MQQHAAAAADAHLNSTLRWTSSSAPACVLAVPALAAQLVQFNLVAPGAQAAPAAPAAPQPLQALDVPQMAEHIESVYVKCSPGGGKTHGAVRAAHAAAVPQPANSHIMCQPMMRRVHGCEGHTLHQQGRGRPPACCRARGNRPVIYCLALGSHSSCAASTWPLPPTPTA
jgi:hypothetical protein